MPIPNMTGLPPFAQYQDMVDKMNTFVQQYNNLMLSLDSLNVVSLTADHIDAGTINSNIVTIRADLTGGASIVLDGNGIRINDGSEDVFFADNAGNVTLKGVINARGGTIGGFTITTTMLSGPGVIQGGTIRTADETTYPRVELDSTGNIFQAFRTDTDFVAIDPDLTGSATILVDNGSAFGIISNILNTFFINCITGNLKLGSNGRLIISAGGGSDKVEFDSWSDIKNANSGRTLQQDLDDLQNQIDSLDGRVTALGG